MPGLPVAFVQRGFAGRGFLAWRGRRCFCPWRGGSGSRAGVAAARVLARPTFVDLGLILLRRLAPQGFRAPGGFACAAVRRFRVRFCVRSRGCGARHQRGLCNPLQFGSRRTPKVRARLVRGCDLLWLCQFCFLCHFRRALRTSRTSPFPTTCLPPSLMLPRLKRPLSARPPMLRLRFRARRQPQLQTPQVLPALRRTRLRATA